MKNLIIVPTYWKLTRKSIFDHPTSLTEKGTLGRLLESLEKLGIKEEVNIFHVPLHVKVKEKVNKICKNYPGLNIDIFSHQDLKKIYGTLKNNSFGKDFFKQMNMEDYSHIRNMGSITGAVKKADNLILIDDDEVVEDKKFMKKAIEFMDRLSGKCGFYLNKSGSYLIKKEIPEWKKYWPKEKEMNKAFTLLAKSKKRLNKANIALGGNMVISKRLFLKVPFDPYITRGEDIDYLLNAKFYGFKFMFDNKLKIKHLPPKKHIPRWQKLRRDMYRFFYLREKMKYFNFKPCDIDSYPGFFLRKNLEEISKKTCIGLAKYYLKNKKIKEYHETKKNIVIISHMKRCAIRNVPKYLTFKKNWDKLMSILSKEPNS